MLEGAFAEKSSLIPSSHWSFSDDLYKALFCSLTSKKADNSLSIMQHLKQKKMFKS